MRRGDLAVTERHRIKGSESTNQGVRLVDSHSKLCLLGLVIHVERQRSWPDYPATSSPDSRNTLSSVKINESDPLIFAAHGTMVFYMAMPSGCCCWCSGYCRWSSRSGHLDPGRCLNAGRARHRCASSRCSGRRGAQDSVRAVTQTPHSPPLTE